MARCLQCDSREYDSQPLLGSLVNTIEESLNALGVLFGQIVRKP